MSQPAVAAAASLPFELVYDDGVPVESRWHDEQMGLLKGLIRQVMAEQGRTDFVLGANNFVYYSVDQARDVYEEVVKDRRPATAFRGPDVYWVGGVDPRRKRKAWVSWEEGGRLPDVIVELLSPSTAEKDRTIKKDLYERVFGTAEYYLCDPDARTLRGYRLGGKAYRPLVPDAHGRLWSEQLGASLGFWHGIWAEAEDHWVRLFRRDGSLVPTAEEVAEAALLRAEAERQRAEAAEAELARLRSLLAQERR